MSRGIHLQHPCNMLTAGNFSAGGNRYRQVDQWPAGQENQWGVASLSGPLLAVIMHTSAGSLRTFQDKAWKILGTNNFKFMGCFTPIER